MPLRTLGVALTLKLVKVSLTINLVAHALDVNLTLDLKNALFLEVISRLPMPLRSPSTLNLYSISRS